MSDAQTRRTTQPNADEHATADRLSVLLADDHTLVRQGLRQILESDPEIQVVGEVGDGRSAVETANTLRPTVVVMDIGLPGMNGIEATRQITKTSEGVRVLILSMHSDDVYVRQGLKAGAKGYLLKDSEDLDLIMGVKSVARGGSYFSPSVSKVLLSDYLNESNASAGEDAVARLSAREREVLRLVAEGKTNKEIAAMLSLSINTVEAHRKHAMEKLDLHSTAEAVRFALRNGIVQ